MVLHDPDKRSTKTAPEVTAVIIVGLLQHVFLEYELHTPRSLADSLVDWVPSAQVFAEATAKIATKRKNDLIF